MYLIKTPCNEVFVSPSQTEDAALKDFYAHYEDFLVPAVQCCEHLNEQFQVGAKVRVLAADHPCLDKVGTILSTNYRREWDYYEVDASESFPQAEFNRICFFCACELQPVSQTGQTSEEAEQEFTVKWVHAGKYEATYRVQARSQEGADAYVEEHRLELEPEVVFPLSEDYEKFL
jgi:hypothetical protein